MSKNISELAKIIDGKIIGNAEAPVVGITNIENPLKDHITFAQDEKGFKKLEGTEVSCLIVPESISESSKTLIQVKNPKAAWAILLNEFFPPKKYTPGVSDKAAIAESATIGNNVTIEAFVTVSEGAVVGDNTVLRSGVYLADNVKVGNDTLLHPNVMVYENCAIGNKVIVHAGTVIGSDGFGYVAGPEGQQKVPQIGNVVIQDAVEIGANCSIDCATVGSTIICEGVKIDNMVQIAHNVTIGPHSAISSQTGISGSSKVGAFVIMGGKVGLGDHVEIGNQVMVGAGAGFPSGKKIPDGPSVVFGAPARPYAVARKQIAAQLRSAETLAEVKQLRKELDELKKG